MEKQLKTKVIANSDLIDETILKEFCEFMGEDGDDLVKEVLEIYLRNAPEMIKRITNDISANNMKSLAADAHTFKGSSAQVGAVGIASLCREIDDAIQNEQFGEIKQIYDRLIGAYKEVEAIFLERLE
jgi:HPt (histidine-containing phosphotransfer) domain-containing protein